MNRLNQPDVQLEIAFLIAQGMPQREIARKYNTYQAKISRIANNPEMINYIIKERKKLITLTKQALRKIENSSKFKREYQKRVEEMLLNFNTIPH